MMRPLLFVVNILMLKMMVRAEVVADNQAWTHKDIAFNGAAIKDVQNRNVISPRMDFDEWTPLGRGDPLKNDPTFDYLPPVLDKVHYWKPPPSPSTAVRAAHLSSSTAASVMPPHNYNRRFFLTDFSSKKEPAASAYVQYVQQQQPQQRKRPVVPAAAVGHLHLLQHYQAIPKVPLPMLTPPPLYQRPASQAFVTSAVTVASDVTPSTDAGDSAAESKQPPTVRAPPPAQLLRLQQAAAVAAVRPASHSAVIKVLLENEVDRTTVTTAATTTIAAAAGTRAPPPPPTTDNPPFAHYRQPAAVLATGRPMYLIIQGHSKVKTYGLVSKSDDLTSAAAQSAHEHNHIGNGPPPDEPSRRKRDGAARDGGRPSGALAR